MVQLHGPTGPNQIQLVKQEAPELKVIKSLIVRYDNADLLLDDVQCFGSSVDAFITDTFDPETGASGATGKVHDWTTSRRLVESTDRPVILAGGPNPRTFAKPSTRCSPRVWTCIQGLRARMGVRALI